MAIFKCKMCGGTIEFEEGASVGICDSCGTKQTLPRIDDDKKANMYGRANHFRRNNDYDKAMGIYEQILSEDNTDAEAYWSIVLCKYGIEYVEDPSTHKRVPTVNRVQYTSVFADEDYKSALQYADENQKEIYEEEAKTIDEIQKGILAISKNEEPFDVFICYKETDDSGRRTPDSVLANDLYHQLTQEGFKVFFAKITLEDKLGQEYEPYIFAALNSAPVMICLGTKPEYFNAVWVRNEWSRYLALIKKGEHKTLIPAYKDMDPYDLPDEFSNLQSQDMSKLGFMQDIIRGIKKILASDSQNEKKNSDSSAVKTESTDTDKNLKKAFLFIEDGKTKEADKILDAAIETDPLNANAYIGKLLLEAGVDSEDKLTEADTVIFDSKNLERAIRFADDETKNRLNEIKLENAYRVGKKRFENASEENDYVLAKAAFVKVSEYKDAAAMIEQCDLRGKSAKTEKTYNDALILMKSAALASKDSIEKLNKAIRLFEDVTDYEDSENKIDECKRRIEEFRAGIAASKKRQKIIALVISVVGIMLIAFLCLRTFVIAPAKNYKNGISMMESGNYENAVNAFTEAGSYKDSQERITECRYMIAESYFNEGKYKEASDEYSSISGYKDSQDKITECRYMIAESYFSDGKYKEASDAYSSVIGYKNSAEKYNESVYQTALAYWKDGDLDNSNPLFETIKDYKDSADKIHYHDWQKTKTVDATCTEKGSIIYKCSGCGATKTEEQAALGHAWQDATCTEPKKCTRCGETSGSALGHNINGIKCTRCGKMTIQLSYPKNTIMYDAYNEMYMKISDVKVNSNSDGDITVQIQVEKEKQVITNKDPEYQDDLWFWLTVSFYDKDGYLLGSNEVTWNKQLKVSDPKGKKYDNSCVFYSWEADGKQVERIEITERK